MVRYGDEGIEILQASIGLILFNSFLWFVGYITEATKLIEIVFILMGSYIIGLMGVVLFTLSGELYIRLDKKSKEDNWDSYGDTTNGKIGFTIFATLLGFLILYLFF